MKKIQKIILAFMLGIVPIQSALADSKVNELADAAFNGKLEQVKTLIEKEGVDINAKDNDGITALMVATSIGHLEITKYLISKGANVNATINRHGKNISILDMAEANEKNAVADVLRKAGAKALLNKQEQQQLIQQTIIDAQVATARSDMATSQKAIVAKVFADNIDVKTSKPFDPNMTWGKGRILKGWGEWIMQIAGLSSDRWIANKNGIYLKLCRNSNQVPLLWINTRTGAIHFNPSKLLDNANSDGFCRQLRDSYAKDKNNGDKIISLDIDIDKVEF